MKEITKSYVKEELSVIWKPHLCIHSAVCFRGLPKVFDPRVRPWVNPDGAETDEIIRQVKACPSGALSYTIQS